MSTIDWITRLPFHTHTRSQRMNSELLHKIELSSFFSMRYPPTSRSWTILFWNSHIRLWSIYFFFYWFMCYMLNAGKSDSINSFELAWFISSSGIQYQTHFPESRKHRILLIIRIKAAYCCHNGIRIRYDQWKYRSIVTANIIAVTWSFAPDLINMVYICAEWKSFPNSQSVCREKPYQYISF